MVYLVAYKLQGVRHHLTWKPMNAKYSITSSPLGDLPLGTIGRVSTMGI